MKPASQGDTPKRRLGFAFRVCNSMSLERPWEQLFLVVGGLTVIPFLESSGTVMGSEGDPLTLGDTCKRGVPSRTPVCSWCGNTRCFLASVAAPDTARPLLFTDLAMRQCLNFYCS